MMNGSSIILVFALVVLATALPAQEDPRIPIITGADSTKYANAYIEELRSSGLVMHIAFDDSLMVVDGMEYFFPTDLERDRWYTFSANSEKGLIELRVLRTNYTNLHYELWITDGERRNEDEGEVIGGPGILGSENDEDDRSYVSYFCTEYTACSLHCCRSIRIGGNDTDELVAKYTRHCDQPGRDIGLDDLPTLRLEDASMK